MDPKKLSIKKILYYIIAMFILVSALIAIQIYRNTVDKHIVLPEGKVTTMQQATIHLEAERRNKVLRDAQELREYTELLEAFVASEERFCEESIKYGFHELSFGDIAYNPSCHFEREMDGYRVMVSGDSGEPWEQGLCFDSPDDCTMFYLELLNFMLTRYGNQVYFGLSLDSDSFFVCWRLEKQNKPGEYDVISLDLFALNPSEPHSITVGKLRSTGRLFFVSQDAWWKSFAGIGELQKSAS